MAKPILVANWKNYPSSIAETTFLLKGLSLSKLVYKKLSLFIAPPLTYFDLVSLKVGSYAKLASQDISLTNKTTTGAVTVDILKSFGVKLSIIGHSERRALGETSEEVSQKIKSALRSGITPLVCVGELSHDQDGEHFEFLRKEIKLSLAGLNKSDASKISLAYEPVWAIGKQAKDAIKPIDLSQTVIFMRKVLTDMFGRKTAENIPILYGGSVEANNAKMLISETGVRGFLVGHSSLDPKSFRGIAQALISK